METGKLPASTHYACREIAEKLAEAEAKLAHFEELAGERLVQISDDAAHIAVLEKALKPFAEEARKGLNFDSICPVDLAQVFSITVGDLRHAAALLKRKK